MRVSTQSVKTIYKIVKKKSDEYELKILCITNVMCYELDAKLRELGFGIRIKYSIAQMLRFVRTTERRYTQRWDFLYQS